MEILLSIFGLIIGIMGIVYAKLQNKEKEKLETVLRANNWYNYHRVDNSSRTVKLALEHYKIAHEKNLDPRVIELLAKADGLGDEIMKDVVYSIQIFEPSFDREQIKRWKSEGKISPKSAELFNIFCVDSKNNLSANKPVQLISSTRAARTGDS